QLRHAFSSAPGHRPSQSLRDQPLLTGSLWTDSDIGEGDRARMDLEANEPRIRVLTLLSAPKLLVGSQGVSRERRGRLPIEHHLVGAMGDLDRVRVPAARREPLAVGVVLLAGHETERDLVDGAGPVVREPVRLALAPVTTGLLVDLDLVAGVDGDRRGI